MMLIDFFLFVIGGCTMLSLKGIYENGLITISLPLPIKKIVEVIVTFLEEINGTATGKVDLKSFSFKKTQ